jgi:hypothetical protein
LLPCLFLSVLDIFLCSQINMVNMIYCSIYILSLAFLSYSMQLCSFRYIMIFLKLFGRRCHHQVLRVFICKRCLLYCIVLWIETHDDFGLYIFLTHSLICNWIMSLVCLILVGDRAMHGGRFLYIIH